MKERIVAFRHSQQLTFSKRIVYPFSNVIIWSDRRSRIRQMMSMYCKTPNVKAVNLTIGPIIKVDPEIGMNYVYTISMRRKF